MSKRKFFVLYSTLLTLFYVLDFAVLTPIYSLICANILYSETFLPAALEILIEISRFVIWCHIFSFIIAAGKREKKESAGIFAVTTVIIFLRYTASVIITALFYNPISASDILYAAENYAFDLLQIGCVLIVSNIFSKIISKISPQAFSAASAAFIVSAVRITVRIVFDIGYGAPDSPNEILLMAVYYMSDILYGVILFFSVRKVSDIITRKK